MKPNQYVFKAKVWLYPGESGAWHFVTLPKKLSRDIKTMFGELGRGFGSLRVRATVGATSWKTSIFPDSKRGAYVLPLKAEVRKKEKLAAGDTIALDIALLFI